MFDVVMLQARCVFSRSRKVVESLKSRVWGSRCGVVVVVALHGRLTSSGVFVVEREQPRSSQELCSKHSGEHSIARWSLESPRQAKASPKRYSREQRCGWRRRECEPLVMHVPERAFCTLVYLGHLVRAMVVRLLCSIPR
nr:hypothetical protein CFP56_09365 [Quercus suber]